MMPLTQQLCQKYPKEFRHAQGQNGAIVRRTPEGLMPKISLVRLTFQGFSYIARCLGLIAAIRCLASSGRSASSEPSGFCTTTPLLMRS